MTDFENLCMNCMSDMQGKAVCPVCGYQKDKPQKKGALPYGTVLQNRYAVGCAKKTNGEGITYIGFDKALNIPVGLHEYFPATLAERADDGKTVNVLGGNELAFKENLDVFLNYARARAHMRDLSSVVLIYDIFEENKAAYTVSEWEDSITLRYFVKKSGGNLGWNMARQLFMPVLSDLSALHANSINHFGISPDTLLIMKDGKMKLGGFSIPAVRQMDTDLAPDLVPGCAAIEQYIMGDPLTEATDVYGFAASLFFVLTGKLPPEAPKRRNDTRLLIPNAILHTLPPYAISALANALQIDTEKRTQAFELLRGQISVAPAVTAAIEASQKFDKVAPQQKKASVPDEGAKAPKASSSFRWGLLSCLAMLVIFAVIGIVWMNHSGEHSQLSAAQNVSSQVSQPASEPSSSEDSEPDDEKITVPNLIGQKYSEIASASSNSTDRQYQILLSSPQFSDTIPEGCILSQDPKPGTKMLRNTAIVVVVSQGAAVRTLPDIKGKTLSEASAAVTSARFVPTAAEQPSSTVSKWKVIGYQKAEAGNQMAYGTKVTIIVSSGSDDDDTTSSEQ